MCDREDGGGGNLIDDNELAEWPTADDVVIIIA